MVAIKTGSDVERQSRWSTVVRGWLHDNERTQAWLARRAKVHPMHLSNCLLGKAKVGISVLSRLEDAMGMDPGTLLMAARESVAEPRNAAK